jgi:hypothetical protein
LGCFGEAKITGSNGDIFGRQDQGGDWGKFGMEENDNGKQLLTNQYHKKKQNMLRIVG